MAYSDCDISSDNCRIVDRSDCRHKKKNTPQNCCIIVYVGEDLMVLKPAGFKFSAISLHKTHLAEVN